MLSSNACRAAAAPRFSNYIISLRGPQRVGLVNDLCEKVVHPSQGVIERTVVSSLGDDVTLRSKVQMPTIVTRDVEPLLKRVFADFHVECMHESHSIMSPNESKYHERENSMVDHTTQHSANVGTHTRVFSIMGPHCTDILERLTFTLTQQHHMQLIGLDTEVKSGTHVGYDIFNAQVTVALPDGQDLDSVFAQRLSNELGVELTLSSE